MYKALKMKNVQLLFLLTFLCLNAKLFAQKTSSNDAPRKYEVGLNFGQMLNSIFTSSDERDLASTKYFLLFRKHLDDNQAIRFRLGGGVNAMARGLFNDDEEDNAFASQLSIFTAVGREKKQRLSEKIVFNYGFEIPMDFAIAGSKSNNNSSNRYSVTTGLRFIGGVKYKVADRLHLGLEAEVFGEMGFQNTSNNGSGSGGQNRAILDAGYFPVTMFYCSYTFEKS